MTAKEIRDWSIDTRSKEIFCQGVLVGKLERLGRNALGEDDWIALDLRGQRNLFWWEGIRDVKGRTIKIVLEAIVEAADRIALVKLEKVLPRWPSCIELQIDYQLAMQRKARGCRMRLTGTAMTAMQGFGGYVIGERKDRVAFVDVMLESFVTDEMLDEASTRYKRALRKQKKQSPVVMRYEALTVITARNLLGTLSDVIKPDEVVLQGPLSMQEVGY